MATPSEMRLNDLDAKYREIATSPRYARLYENDPRFGHMFAVLHERLNGHFESINDRARSTRHYWADSSRGLLALIDDVWDDLHNLSLAGIEARILPAYEQALEDLKAWLSPSGGSTVPDDFTQIDVRRQEPIFVLADGAAPLQQLPTSAEMKMIGSGSYANVYSYIDPNYGVKFAVKRAKRDIEPRDLERFRREFDVMSALRFPYIVEVYKYDDERNEYRMEFCDATLREYIAQRNASLPFASRKRIALQFLYGINFIHSEGHLHRDVSLQNVLVKVFSKEAVLIKLSDFGLVKQRNSVFTRTETDMRGTIRDPVLHDFKSYALPNELYAIGWVISYVFSGREVLPTGSDDIAKIVRKCTDLDVAGRYASVLDLIGDVEKLVTTPSEDSA